MPGIVVVGGGIVGLAVARALALRGLEVTHVLEAEPRIAAHQTSHNSGVIHSGLYYRPGSRKAQNCVEGRERMFRYCQEKHLPHERCGKLVVATSDEQVHRLLELERRGQANGLLGLRRLDAQGVAAHEPHVTARAGLWVPETGITDYAQVAAALAEDLQACGTEVRTSARVTGVARNGESLEVRTSTGVVRAGGLINCAGAQSDRIARLCALDPGVRILPFRGEFHRLARSRETLVRNPIYPVPDPALPFLGVHFTRKVAGGIVVGPNAVLATSRNGYGWGQVLARDIFSIVSWAGSWRMARRHWRAGLGEVHRSWSRRALAREVERMVPGILPADLEPYGSGVRAQAVARDGSLLDDFHIVEGPRMMHVLNAPSPAATAALSIGEALAQRWEELHGPR